MSLANVAKCIFTASPTLAQLWPHNEARNGHGGLYKANNKGKIALTAAVRGSAVIIEPISSGDCLVLSPA